MDTSRALELAFTVLFSPNVNLDQFFFFFYVHSSKCEVV